MMIVQNSSSFNIDDAVFNEILKTTKDLDKIDGRKIYQNHFETLRGPHTSTPFLSMLPHIASQRMHNSSADILLQIQAWLGLQSLKPTLSF